MKGVNRNMGPIVPPLNYKSEYINLLTIKYNNYSAYYTKLIYIPLTANKQTQVIQLKAYTLIQNLVEKYNYSQHVSV